MNTTFYIKKAEVLEPPWLKEENKFVWLIFKRGEKGAACFLYNYQEAKEDLRDWQKYLDWEWSNVNIKKADRIYGDDECSFKIL